MRDISTAATGDKLVNIPETITTMTNNIVCRASFGDKCPNQPKFIALMTEVVKLVSGFNVADLFPSVNLYNVKANNLY
ncbi:cytochrome P450 mono-oxygenase [Canna indica]|uniref:Cytochrome P450 mono-oxygenase n=1 Tax=Canna indica TaxID=4628 RepID=A0AAQ3KCF7_9LILI|nr:cytochrome P450 mono-oxygenase [Canna indica]